MKRLSTPPLPVEAKESQSPTSGRRKRSIHATTRRFCNSFLPKAVDSLAPCCLSTLTWASQHLTRREWIPLHIALKKRITNLMKCIAVTISLQFTAHVQCIYCPVYNSSVLCFYCSALISQCYICNLYSLVYSCGHGHGEIIFYSNVYKLYRGMMIKTHLIKMEFKSIKNSI